MDKLPVNDGIVSTRVDRQDNAFFIGRLEHRSNCGQYIDKRFGSLLISLQLAAKWRQSYLPDYQSISRSLALEGAFHSFYLSYYA
ncbi:hypothetical protein JTE90_029173 [Oedothorax gibbosus]|uniref:Uncharacterized protein n=1 Tax=Oedothorax gibbosus TaxID=931172 RepID=A0AAV6VFT9_9ARAC|nr:hypothetical protein JTE90_029173 [Oedothorax gibbosus]